MTQRPTRFHISIAPLVREVAAQFDCQVIVNQKITARETSFNHTFGTPEYRGMGVKRFLTLEGDPENTRRARAEIRRKLAASDPSPS